MFASLRCQRIFCLLLFSAACAGAGAQDFRGRCTGVSGGDTLEVQKGPRRVTIRLAGIAAPEPAQPCGADARKALTAAALGRELLVSEKFGDRAGVIHAVIRTAPDSTATLNAVLVAGGWAWSDPASSLVKGLEACERQARAARRGLWADPAPIPPWEWRRLAAAGKLPTPRPATFMAGESDFDRMVKAPTYGATEDAGLLKNVIEARRRQTAYEDTIRQAAARRSQAIFSSPSGSSGIESYYGSDPLGRGAISNFSFGASVRGRSYGSGNQGSGMWSYYPQPTARTNGNMNYFFPNVHVPLGGYD